MQSPGRSAGASSTRARGWVGHRSSEFFDFYSSKNSLKLNREFSHKKYKNKLIFLPGESSHLIIIIILCDILFFWPRVDRTVLIESLFHSKIIIPRTSQTDRTESRLFGVGSLEHIPNPSESVIFQDSPRTAPCRRATV